MRINKPKLINGTSKIQHLVFILLIFFLGIIAPLSFFKNNLPLVGLDAWPPLNTDLRMKEWPYLWGYFSSILGVDYSGRIVFFPQTFSYHILHLLGLSLMTSQKIVFCQIFLTAGFSMYFLSMTIWKKKPIAAFIAALIFMFNPVMAGFWQQFLYDTLYSFVAFPLLLAVFIRGLESKKVFNYSILFAFLTLFFLPYNLPVYVIGVGILGSFLIFKLLTEKEKMRRFKFSILALVFSILINLWWIFPQFILLPTFMNYYTSEIKLASRLVTQGFRANIPNSIRLVGNSYWGYSFWEDKVSNYIGYLYDNNPFLIVLSFVYPLLAFAAIALSKKNKTVIFFSVMSLIFIFLTKGLNRPLGSVYEFLFKKVPGFFIFRTPSDKFWLAILVFYALLIGFTVSTFFEKVSLRSRPISRIFFFFVVAILLVAQWPFFSGDVIPNGKSALPSIEFNPPSYYHDLSEWLKKQKDSFRILNLPAANRPTRWLVYKWGFLGVYPILSEMFEKPVIEKQPQEPSDFIRNTVYYQLGNSSDLSLFIDQKVAYNNNVYKILGLMNTKYILVNYDTDWLHLHFGTEDPKDLENNLSKQVKINHTIDYGNFHLYGIGNEDLLPEIYPVLQGKETYYFGNKNQIGNLFSFSDFLPENLIYLNEAGLLNNKSKIFITTDYQYFRDDFKRNYEEIPTFPYVRFLPNNPFYYFVDWKEQRKKTIAEGAEEKIATNLFLSKKRLAEIKKIVDERKSYSPLKVLKRYKKNIDEIISMFEREKSKDRYGYALATDLMAELNYQENFLRWFMQVRHEKGSSESYDFIKPLFENWYKTLDGYMRPWWFDRNLVSEKGQIAYGFNIPKDGEYEFLMNSSDLKNLTVVNGKFTVKGTIKSKNGFQKDVSWSQKGGVLINHWYQLTKETLLAGDYVLTFINQETENLCGSCRWETIGKGDVIQRKETVENSSNSILRIEIPDGESTAFYNRLFTSDSTDNFRISFSFQNISGEPLKLTPYKTKLENFTDKDFYNHFKGGFLSEKVKSAIVPDDQINVYKSTTIGILSNMTRDLKKGSGWQRIVFDFNPGEGTKVFGIILSSIQGSMYGEPSINEIKDFRIEKVFDNPIVIRNNVETETPGIRPLLKFKRVNPTRYEIEVQNSTVPFDLLFGQSFSSGWKAYLSEGSVNGEVIAEYLKVNSLEIAPDNIFFKYSYLFKPGSEQIPENKHFLANGYSNSWKIEKTGNFKVVILYEPQRYFYYLLSLSIFLISMGILFGLFQLIRKYGKNKNNQK